ncbi:MAG: THUMP domain-containing protein [Zoogloeaceae bacterium]|jgi:putative N6-adenine-specific DNA methylase|nr:THUMP domain-containing protein [Zoogloeaceae bacterium]
METFFASCPRGLEGLLVEELTAAGASSIRAAPGGVGFSGDWPLCWRMNLESRIATRILWRLQESVYHAEEDIYRAALALAWEKHFDLSRTFRVETTAIRAPLKSLDFVTLRIKDAVCDRFRARLGERPSIDTHAPEVRIHAFLTQQHCTLYLDTSGAPLWQRGLRHANVDAPLKENLAAGILKLSGWRPGIPLLDPMCGSGTFALEAAAMTLGRPPGLERVRFGFEALNGFVPERWQALRNAALANIREAAGPPCIFASDIDMRAVRATRRNLEDAGLDHLVRVERRDILACRPPEPAVPGSVPDSVPTGILVANPPYGERIGDLNHLAELYPALGSTLKRHFAGWTACFLTADTRFPKLLRLSPKRRTPLFNGALECRLYEIRMVAGSCRRQSPTR